ncbi:MAG: tetratricopeptide repeat protein [Bacteroidota bacterium]
MRSALLLLLSLLFFPLTAQTGTLSEKGINRQSSFIEAKREALLGKTDKAIGMFKELAEAEPENDAIQFELGRLQFAAGDTEAAIDHLRAAYATRPNEIYASFLAELYQASGRHKEGAALFAELIRKDPGNEEYYLEQAAFLVRAQDVKGAINVYDELQDRIGINPELTRRKHALYLGQGDQKRAEKELLALIEAQPRQLAHRHLLAGYYQSQGEKAKARKAYQDILAIQPADVRAQLALQETGKPIANGNDDQLMALLGRADVDVDLKIGKLLPLVNQVARARVPADGQRAMALAAELRRVHPDEAKAAALQGDLYFHTGQLTAAADAYRTTLELDDTVYPVWEQLLATLYLDNQIVELRKYAEEALDVYPNRPAVYVHYALGEALRADFAEAQSLLEQAQLMVAAQPEAAAALRTLSTALNGLADGDTSADLALDQLPGGPEAPLGFLWRKSGDLAALQAYDHPTNTNALFLEYLGDTLAEQGGKTAAAEAYGRAKAAGSKSSELRAKLSKVGS